MHIMRERLLGGAVRPEDAERREIGSKRGLEGRENRLCGLKCWSECFRTIVGGDLEGIDGVFFNGLLGFLPMDLNLIFEGFDRDEMYIEGDTN